MRSWISNASWYRMILAVSLYCVPIGLSSSDRLVKEGQSFAMDSDIISTRREAGPASSNGTGVGRQ